MRAEPAGEIYPDLASAESFLAGLARLETPWVFDIETYDAAEYPSRKEVSTNPHHPDFRVRGCAFAVSPDRGAWVDFGGSSPLTAPPRALAALRAAFASDAAKGAFNGGFDENGLVYTGWVPTVRNRAFDGMLAMVALGDGTHNSLTLWHAIETILKRPYQWEGEDKSLMRDMPTAQVAKGAVGDACFTLELIGLLDSWAEQGQHIEWSKLGQRSYADIAKRKKSSRIKSDPDSEVAAIVTETAAVDFKVEY
jgi:hypothetical protein